MPTRSAHTKAGGRGQLELLTNPAIWKTLEVLARTGPGRVAVPYFAQSAADMLPLLESSVLVTRISEPAARAGQVSRDDLVKLAEAGVEIWSVPNLHAKVYVFDGTAVLGSSNVSATSKELVEACWQTSNPKAVKSARDFIDSLADSDAATLWTPDMLRELPQCTPRDFPLANGDGVPTKGPALYLVAMVDCDDSAAVKRARAAAEEQASARAPRWIVDSVHLSGNNWRLMRKGDHILPRHDSGETASGHGCEGIGPLAVIQAIEYVSGQKGAVIGYAWPASRKRLTVRQVRKAMGSIADVLMEARALARRATASQSKAFRSLWRVR